MHIKSLYFASIVFIGTYCQTSCIDSRYDLSKDISPDISIGNKTFFLPIGSTEELRLKDLIDIESSESLVIEDGRYTLKKKDNIEPTKVIVEDLLIDQISSEFEDFYVNFNNEFIGAVPPEFENMKVMISEPIKGLDSKFTVNQSVPEEIISLLYVLADRNMPLPTMTFSIRLEGLDPSVKEVSMHDIEIQLPVFVNYNDDGSDLKIENGLVKVPNKAFNPHTESYTNTVRIESIDFSNYSGGRGAIVNEDKKVIVNEENDIRLTGNFLAAMELGVAAKLERIKIIPEFIIEEFYVSRVEALLSPSIDDVKKTIGLELGDDLNFLKQNAVLELLNPQISLTMESNVGIPFNVKSRLVGMDKTMNPIQGSNTEIEGIEIKRATLDDNNDLKNSVSNILISATNIDYIQPDFQHIINPAITNIFKTIPDNINLNLEIKPTKSWTREEILNENLTKEYIQSEKHIVDLNKDMNINPSYEVNIPLVFKELSINYKDTIDNLHKDLKDIVDIVKNLQLGVEMKVKNTIPCSLDLEATAYDSNGNSLDNISLLFSDENGVNAVIPADCHDGKNLILKIKAGNKDIERLDRIILNIKGDIAHSETGEPLEESQFIKIEDMTLYIDGNIEMEIK